MDTAMANVGPTIYSANAKVHADIDKKCEICERNPQEVVNRHGLAICMACAEAVTPPIRRVPHPHRNELCPCGSDKKYKKCCGFVQCQKPQLLEKLRKAADTIAVNTQS